MMPPRKQILWRLSLAAVSLLVLLGVLAPFLSAERFAARVRTALESSLGRKVEFQTVRFNLFRGPGFSVRKVVIHEDPQFGVEPVAYVDSLEARVRLRGLWTGDLEFSNLRLVEPSLNLARNAAGIWNSQPLIRRATVGLRPSSSPPPTIQIRSGRLNFKFGEWKSVYYFGNVDMDLNPGSQPEDGFGLRFDGEPARTDLAARPFGRLRVYGRWRPSRNGEGRIEGDLELEKSALGEVMMLVRGQDIGIHGIVAAKARFAGAPSAIRIDGRIQLEDIHRWDLMPSKEAQWPLHCNGRLDLTSQRLELDALPRDNPGLRLALRLRVIDFLSASRWAATVTAERMPLGPVIETARHMGAPLPPSAAIEGEVTGVIGYSPERGFQGQVSLERASFQLPASVPVRLEKASIVVDGETLQLPPAILKAASAAAQIEAAYDRRGRKLGLKLSTRSLPVPEVLTVLGTALPPPLAPHLDACREGVLSGWLRFEQQGEAPGEWAADLGVRDARVSVDGLAAPLWIRTGRVVINGAKPALFHFGGDAGDAEVGGDYQFQPDARRPHRLRLNVDQLDARELEGLFLPTLRRRQGFLARTLRLTKAPLPAWLRERKTEGTLDIGTFILGDLTLRKVRLRYTWDGPDFQAAIVSAHLGDGQVSGTLSVDVSEPAPRYKAGGRVEGISWPGETIGLEAALAASGRYEFRWDRESPRLEFIDLRVRLGEEQFEGQGGSLPEGRLEFELSGEKTQLRLQGTLSPLHLEMLPPR